MCITQEKFNFFCPFLSLVGPWYNNFYSFLFSRWLDGWTLPQPFCFHSFHRPSPKHHHMLVCLQFLLHFSLLNLFICNKAYKCKRRECDSFAVICSPHDIHDVIPHISRTTMDCLAYRRDSLARTILFDWDSVFKWNSNRKQHLLDSKDLIILKLQANPIDSFGPW